MLKVDNISFSYYKKNIFNNVTLELKKGALLCLLGPNGVGKTTLLKCIAGLLKIDEGKIFLDSIDLYSLKRNEITKKIAYVSQISNISFPLKVKDYVVMGRTPYIDIFSTPTKDDYKLVTKILEKMNVINLSENLYSTLSSGQRQLIDICRIMMQDPEIILFDEPTSALDIYNQIKLFKLIKQLEKKNYTIIISTHNPDHAILLGGYLGILHKDRIFNFGETKKILNKELLKSLYSTDNLELIWIDIVKRYTCIINNIN